MEDSKSFSLPTLRDLLKNIQSNKKNEVLRIIDEALTLTLTHKKVPPLTFSPFVEGNVRFLNEDNLYFLLQLLCQWSRKIGIGLRFSKWSCKLMLRKT